MDQNNLYPVKTVWENKTPSGPASVTALCNLLHLASSTAEFSPVFLALLLSVTAQPVNMRLTYKVLFRFFSAFCSDKAQGNWDFPEERMTCH